MKCCTLIKCVPSNDASINSSGEIDRSKSRLSINQADYSALELALRLKEETGCSITVLSMGVPSSERILQKLYCYCIEEVVLLQDPRLAGSDTIATANALVYGLNYLGGFDLVIAGNATSDSSTGQVPSELASLLHVDYFRNVESFEQRASGLSFCTRIDSTRITTDASKKAVLSVDSCAFPARLPSINGIKAARGKEVRSINCDEMMIPQHLIGKTGSKTKVKHVLHIKRTATEPIIVSNRNDYSASIINHLFDDSPLIPNEQSTIPKVEPACETPFSVALYCQGINELYRLEKLLSKLRIQAPRASFVLLKDIALPIAPSNISQCYDSIIEFRGGIMTARNYAKIIESILTGSEFRMGIFPSSDYVRAFLPMVAASINVGLTADCTDLSIDKEGHLLQTRPTFGGELIATIESVNSDIQLATYHSPKAPAPMVDNLKKYPLRFPIRSIEPCGHYSIEEIGALIAGKGVGTKENCLRVKRLAAALGCGFGVTRGCVDMGWESKAHQVGQTGIFANCKNAVMLGVGGAIEHLLGFSSGCRFLAVDNVRRTRMFSYSKTVIVDDVNNVLDELEQYLANENGAHIARLSTL